MNRTQDYILTVVIPVFNEQESLNALFKALEEFEKVAKVKTCFLFVNDCSNDNSLAMIEKYTNEHSNFYYISLAKRSGLTGALKAGFSIAQSPWVGYIDADLQTFPEDFNLLLDFTDKADLICGIRAKRQDSDWKKFQSKVANKIRNFVTHDNISDTNCPLKILKSTLAHELPLYSGMHRFLPALSMLMGYKVHTIEVRHQQRNFGQSKFNFFNRAFSSFIDLLVFIWMRKKYIKIIINKQNIEQ